MAEKVVIGNAELWHGDCLEVLADLSRADAVISDPPYPNNAELFLDGIRRAKAFICLYECDEWVLFWDEMTEPLAPQPLVAKHAWHRTNTNRPDNYEMIYHYHADGKNAPAGFCLLL